MQPRLDYAKASPELFKSLYALQVAINHCSLPHDLMELVKLRASQLNGCAYCIAMHVRDARKLGVAEERLHLLAAWRETPLYDARERAALAWTEALTFIADGHAPDAVYEQVRAQFSDKELAELSFAIGTINVWNRLQIATCALPEVEGVKQAA